MENKKSLYKKVALAGLLYFILIVFVCSVFLIKGKIKENNDFKNSWASEAVFSFQKLEDVENEDGKMVPCYGISTPGQLIGAIMLSNQDSKTFTNNNFSKKQASLINDWSTDQNGSELPNSNGYYKLTNNINLSGKSWDCINLGSNDYKGAVTLDGCGYTISNLKLNKYIEEGTEKYTGFIGKNFGYIKNLKFSNFIIADDLDDYENSPLDVNYIGAVAAINCFIIDNVKVENAYINGTSYVGGIAGINGGLLGYDATISNSFVDGTIKSIKPYNSENVDAGGFPIESCAGGIASINYNYASSVVKNCVNNASVFSNEIAGGIVGNSDSTISSCINFGDIKIEENSYSDTYLGGIVGKVFMGYVEASINKGKLENAGKRNNSAGGIIGGAIIRNFYQEYLVITSSNYGDITSGNSVDTVDYSSYVGGIVGKSMLGTYIKKSINKGNITAGSTKSGPSYGGGIVGYIDNDAAGQILNCFNAGNIEGDSNNFKTPERVLNKQENQISDNGFNKIEKDHSKRYQGDGERLDVELTYKTHEETNFRLVNVNLYLGGIVGETHKDFYITNVYNIGNISTNTKSYISFKNKIVVDYNIEQSANLIAGIYKDLDYTLDNVFYVWVEYQFYIYPMNINFISGNNLGILNNCYSRNILNGKKTQNFSTNGGDNTPTTIRHLYTDGRLVWGYESKSIIYYNSSYGKDDTGFYIQAGTSYAYHAFTGYSGSTKIEDSSMNFNSDTGKIYINDCYFKESNESVLSENLINSTSLGSSVWGQNSEINDDMPFIKDLYWGY